MDKQERKKLTDAYKARRAVGGVFAVRNSANGKILVQYTTEIQGSRNRFEFSQATGGCAFKPLQEDYNKFGNKVFSFEILEQLEQKEGQSDDSFTRDIEALYSMIIEGMDSEKLY
jgi:hypothetical protein